MVCKTTPNTQSKVIKNTLLNDKIFVSLDQFIFYCNVNAVVPKKIDLDLSYIHKCEFKAIFSRSIHSKASVYTVLRLTSSLVYVLSKMYLWNMTYVVQTY